MRIAAEDGVTEVPPGVAGEIQFRGANALRGNLNEPEATAATIIDGRVGPHRRPGRVHRHRAPDLHRPRSRRSSRSAGRTSRPPRSRPWLEHPPGRGRSPIVGKPDDKYGEVPVAFVELLPGKDCTPDELIEHCRGQLANFKIPREVRFVTEWPMSATKIQKFRLRELV